LTGLQNSDEIEMKIMTRTTPVIQMKATEEETNMNPKMETQRKMKRPKAAENSV